MYFRLTIAGSAAWLLAAAAPAHAATTCAADALNALRIADITVTEAKPVAAAGQIPSHCQVLGTVVTRGEGAPDGLARFSMQLPDAWKQRFLFLGVGGNAGTLGASANNVDRAAALGKGYAVILTDTGHVGDGTTAKWARKADGGIDQAKLTDFFFRAAHDVGVAGKAFAQAYYAAPILHAYFDGCSTGGRMALMEAERYPDDYTGVIAGDPAMDYNLQLARMTVQKAALSTPGSYISPELLAALDAKVTARCDGLDGAKDGLVQNPAKCPVQVKDLTCRAGETQGCLTAAQAVFFKSYLAPKRDRHGRIVYPGWPITNLAGAGGAIFYTFGTKAPNPQSVAAPWGDDKSAPRGWALGRETLTNYLGDGPSADMTKIDINTDTNVVGDELLARVTATMNGGDADEPARLKSFIAKGGKLIMYHGASDPSIPAERTLTFYRQLVALMKGDARTQANVRLFLVPGMQHCGGGAGPDRFDTLTPLEAWVEQGQAPAAIQASTAPEAAVQHNLPLCPYPAQARYSGTGDVTAASNWACKVAPAAKPKAAKQKAANGV